MTDEQIRIAVAECRGWKWYLCNQLQTYTFVNDPIPIDSVYFWEPCTKPQREFKVSCPDYPNDLNAMHEAISTLTDDQLIQFGYHLMDVLGFKHSLAIRLGIDGIVKMVRAKARQLAEAYLRTLGKWKE